MPKKIDRAFAESWRLSVVGGVGAVDVALSLSASPPPRVERPSNLPNSVVCHRSIAFPASGGFHPDYPYRCSITPMSAAVHFSPLPDATLAA